MPRHQPVAPVGDYLAYHVTAKSTLALPIGQPVNTTTTTSISAGSQTVTPADMTNIVAGIMLVVSDGTGTAEEVQVTAVTATTFTATFANTHTGTTNLRSKKLVNLGDVFVNSLGTGMTLTLYNGNPDATLLAAYANAGKYGGPSYGAIGVFTPSSSVPFLPFKVACDFGLYVLYAGTTPGDLTILYRPNAL